MTGPARSTRIDCDGCRARGPACGECVVSVLLGPPEDVELDGPTRDALAVLAEAGLVPHLRLVAGGPRPAPVEVARRVAT